MGAWGRALAGLAIALAACGYEWVGARPPLPGARRVAIRPLANRTFEPGIELVVSDALRRELARRPGVRLVDDPARADLVISGAVASLSTRPRSFSSLIFALEYEVALRIEVEVDGPQGKRRIDPGSLAASEVYLASADIEAQRKNREEALRRLAALLAERVTDLLAEPPPP